MLCSPWRSSDMSLGLALTLLKQSPCAKWGPDFTHQGLHIRGFLRRSGPQSIRGEVLNLLGEAGFGAKDSGLWGCMAIQGLRS